MQTAPNSNDQSEHEALAVRFLTVPLGSARADSRRKLTSVAPQSLGWRSEPFLSLRAFRRLTSRVQSVPLFLKRAIDIVFAALGLLTLSPVMAVIAVVIKLDSRGPAFYCASRAGKNGRNFICCKFRTMVLDADRMKAALRSKNERDGPVFKIVRDPRITRVGKILRRYSLDEIPQLWNVLLGDMSLVGPRPHPLDDFRSYIERDLRRLDVTPGITGLWQVTARGDPSFQRNMALDLEYIERWTLLMDLRILYKTIFAVVRGTGA